VEGLFSKYGATGERKVGQPGRHASDNMIARLTECHFLRKVQPTEMCCVPSTVERWRLCVPSMVERWRLCAVAKCVM
jgi:hypothetical protein